MASAPLPRAQRASNAVLVVAVGLLALPAAASDAAPVVFLGNEKLEPVVFLESGEARGVAVEIARALAPYLSRPLDIRATDWAEAQARVARGEADALIQINRTEERARVYDFSEPLLDSQFSIFVRSDRVGVTGLSSLSGDRVGVEKAGLPRLILENDPHVRLTMIPDFAQGFRLVQEGALDAVVVDYRVGAYILAKNGIRGIRVVGEPVARSASAFAVRKGNTELLAEIDSALRAIRADGTYQRILERWSPTEGVFRTREQVRRFVNQAVAGTLLAVLTVGVAWIATLRRALARQRAAEAKLSDQCCALQAVASERKRAEDEIRALNRELEARVDELDASNRELETFAYTISHDLRAPVRHIHAFTAMLGASEPRLDARGRRCLERLSESSTRMCAQIDALVDYLRLGREALSDEEVALGALAREVIQERAPETVGREVRWRVGELPVVNGDRDMLRVVLNNLLANALKFTRARPVAEIEIGWTPEAGADKVFVRDNGVGFDMAYAGKLFRVFQRLHRYEEFAGTGIGLAEVQRIVRRHGGWVGAEAAVGEGATFCFTLPRARGAAGDRAGRRFGVAAGGREATAARGTQPAAPGTRR